MKSNCKGCEFEKCIEKPSGFYYYCLLDDPADCPRKNKDDMSISGKFGCLGLYDYCTEKQRKNCKDLEKCIHQTSFESKKDKHPPKCYNCSPNYNDPQSECPIHHWKTGLPPEDGQWKTFIKGLKQLPKVPDITIGPIKVKMSFPYNPIGSFSRGDPFTITFVYPSKSKPFILKGGIKDIDTWLLGYGEPCIIHNTYWRAGRSRVSITMKNLLVPVLLCERSWYPEIWKTYNIDKRKHWALIIDKNSSTSDLKVVVGMKRLPRKWIKELNPYIDPVFVKKPSYAKPSDRPRAKEDYRMIRLEDVDSNKQV